MTNPTAAKKTAASRVTEKNETPVVEEKISSETSVVDTPEAEKEVNRIPETLADNPILSEFCKRYLDVLDEIAKYNEEVLAEKDAEWNPSKVLEKSKELANPTDANVPANADIKAARDEWEKIVGQAALARKKVIETTAKALGITLTVTTERDAETEEGLKQKRKLAVAIGTQLSTIAEMTTDKDASAAVTTFFEKNPLPAIGRDQVRSFGSDGKSTPKYRVHITVSDKDGNVKVSEDGFTKTALALPKYYERGKALKSETLRKAWEAAGNTPEKTLVDPVEFDDNDLHFVIKKK